MGKKVAVLITAFNESKNLKKLLSKISDKFDVWIVDDGSSDNTCSVGEEFGAKTIKLCINIGQGAAAITGYRILSNENYEFIIKIDGDGQHNPEDMSKFIDVLSENRADMVIGSRVLGKNYRGAPIMRRLMLKPVTWIINLLTGYNLTDSMCGYRGFTKQGLKKVIPVLNKIEETEYIASEMLIRFSKEGIRIKEVPINMSSRMYGLSYKGFVRYGWGILQVIIRTKIDMYLKVKK